MLTYVQLGTPFELEALRIAAAVAARADEAGLPYVCEIMPVEGEAYPDPASPLVIAAAARAAAELGAHMVKTTMPDPPEAMADVAACGVPVVLAGGDLESDGVRAPRPRASRPCGRGGRRRPRPQRLVAARPGRGRSRAARRRSPRAGGRGRWLSGPRS